ncbi:MAG TPA: 16S rRNA (guanine(527)-N(7))-methyltransferase RsmG [Pseudogracilibacillus sp.]|nr:16S rRNA (guanine(527)-N(7))-methyltransferase RsmG [Pseudogracilibacillus sp.]
MDKKTFASALASQNIQLDEIQLKQYDTYFRLLVEWNEKVNLTAITEEEEVYVKHFYDSISPSFYYDFSKVNTICDIGAGAGFPSIPLLIAFPHLQVTIVDSLKKRINFLDILTKKLNLDKQVTLIHSRAEDVGRDKQLRESFDLVTARAVARTNVLSEYCLPLVKIGGHFIALKGQFLDDEYEESKKAITTLGGKYKERFEFTLPVEAGERNIIVIDKVKKTPKTYPRKAGTPAKKPII